MSPQPAQGANYAARTLARRYGLALAAVAAAVLVRQSLQPVVGPQFPYATVYFAVLFAAWYGGAGPGVTATAVGALAALYLFVPPYRSVRTLSAAELTGFLLYVTNAGWCVVLCELLHRARRRAERSEAEAIAHRDAEARLREAAVRAEERYRVLVENVQDYALILLDPIGRIVSWNPGARRVFGYEESEIVGQHFSLLFTPDDVRAGLPMSELDRALAEGRANEDGWRVRKNGERFWATGVTTPLTSGNARGFAKVVRDWTHARGQVEQAFQQAAGR